jgi:hypothetical protein
MWPNTNQATKAQIVQDLYPKIKGNRQIISDVIAQLDHVLGSGSTVDEGWKSALGGAALAGAMALGGGAHAADATPGYSNLPDIVAHITIKMNGKTIEKEINLGTEYQSPAEAREAVAKWLKEKGITNYFIQLERVRLPKDVDEDAAGVGVVATNKKMAKDPRYSMSMTQDVGPGTPMKNLRAFKLAEKK